ncbi:MAG TPA: hypothetical protein VIK18_04470, partial [Pirellulales bacterium]
LDQLLGYFRDLMVAAVGCPDDALLYVLPAQRADVRAAAQQLGVSVLLAIMQILDQTLTRLRYSTHGRTLAELALVRICSLADLDWLPTLVEQVAAGGSLPASPAVSRPSSPASSGSPAPPGPQASQLRPAAVTVQPEPKKKADLAESAASPPREPESKSPLAGEQLPQIWKQVLEQLSDLTGAQAGVCDHLAISAPNRLVLGFRKKYTSCKSFCERPEQVAKLEKALLTVTGQPIRVEFTTLPDLPDEKPSQPRPRASASQQRLQEATQHPLVRRAMELFEARPVRVENPEP